MEKITSIYCCSYSFDVGFLHGGGMLNQSHCGAIHWCSDVDHVTYTSRHSPVASAARRRISHFSLLSVLLPPASGPHTHRPLLLPITVHYATRVTDKFLYTRRLSRCGWASIECFLRRCIHAEKHWDGSHDFRTKLSVKNDVAGTAEKKTCCVSTCLMLPVHLSVSAAELSTLTNNFRDILSVLAAATVARIQL